MHGPTAVPPDRPLWQLTAGLFATVDGDLWHLGRLEFDPGGEPPHHRNPFTSRQFAPGEISGAHRHSFADNAQIGLHYLSPKENLPVAFPEDMPIRHYDDVLEVIRSRFVIPGFWTEDPSWLLMLA